MKHKTYYTNKRFNPITICSLPLLLAVAACGDGSTLGNVESDLAAGEDVTISISNDDDGNLVIGSSSTADSAAVQEARALLEGLAADGAI